MSRVPVTLMALTCLAIALVVPFVASPNMLTVAMVMLIAALFALSFALLAGQGGMLSFGHAAFFGMGIFATIHLLRAGEAGTLFPTPFIPLAGGLVALLVAIAVGYFVTRRSGIYFSMITFAIAELLYALSPTMPSIFGGESGFSSMRAPWAGISFATDTQVYYLILFWVGLSGVCLHLYTRTLFGRLTVALRENEQRITFLGYDPHKTKVMVFACSGFFSGIAGSLLALMTENAVSTVFTLHTSATVVLHTFIGGASTFLGPAIGAAVLTLLQSVFDGYTRLWFLYQGLIFIAVMIYLPEGLYKAALNQFETIRSGGMSALATFLRRLLGVSLVILPMVFACEFISVFFSPGYSGLSSASGVFAPISVFGLPWAPASPVTLFTPVLVFAIGVMVLRGRLTLSRNPRSRGIEPEANRA